jgi:SAM-dependent methyltransferase
MRTDCRVCHSSRLEPILKLAPTPIGDQFLVTPKEQPLHPIDLYQCQDCGLAQQLYEIPPEEIYRDYLYLTGSSTGLQEHFASYASSAVHNCWLKPGDLVVDIGSNDGTLLQHFKAHGMQALGVEPCEAIADIARRDGIPTLQRYFGKDLGVGKAKLITANNVVANINDLDSFMEAVCDLLAPDGHFIFESFYLGDVVHNMVFDFIYHEHLSAFSVKPVKRLMERYGLQLYRVEHVKTKGGSIRYYCNRYFVGRGNIVGDDDADLYRKETYVEFAERIEAQRAATRAYLGRARRGGATIAGFGASISATTLLYHFDLGEFVDYLVDDNPAKIGRYSPGLHKLVVPCSDLPAMKPDYVIALAWRFADDFRKQYPQFPLIVPLPKFQCIPAS